MTAPVPSPPTLAQIVAALSVTYDDKGIAHWLAAVNNDLWSKPDGNWPCTPLEYVMSGYIADVAAAVERIGDASPADFEITERER